MANSVMQDRFGPDFPLGNIVVTVPGTPVAITSLIDAARLNDPSTPTPGTAGADEYTVNAQQIIFQAVKASAAPPKLANNTGNVYIVRKALAGGGGVGDLGIVIKMLVPGETFVLASSPQNRNVFNLYRYFIDADTANDACQVTALLQ